MKKLVLIGILAIGVSFGSNTPDWSQAIKDNCGNVPLSQCIDFYKEQCNAGKMIHCGFAGDMLNAQHNLYEAKHYYKMACDRIDLDNVYEMQTADDKRLKYDFDSIKYLKAKFCYNFVIASTDFYSKNPKNLTKQDERQIIDEMTTAIKTACDLGYIQACRLILSVKEANRQRTRGDGLRTSDFVYGSIVVILQATIAYVTFVVILKIFKKKKDSSAIKGIAKIFIKIVFTIILLIISCIIYKLIPVVIQYFASSR